VGNVSVPQGVERNLLEAEGDKLSGECMGQPVGVNRPTVRRGEDESVCIFAKAEAKARLSLFFAVPSQFRQQAGREHDSAPAPLCLRLFHGDLAFQHLNSLTDLQCPFHEIDIAPPQPKNLATPQAGICRDQCRHVEAAAP
jgi:hypothetical protein